MRRAPLIALVAACLIAGAVVALLATGSGDDVPALHATSYPEPLASPHTTGRDHLGRDVAVPVDGRPAVVTFLFANCPTVCPLVGSEIAAALDRLTPAQRDGVDVVAISVDPAGDTREAVAGFLRKHHLTGRMRYIVGTRDELAPMWEQWGVEAQPSSDATQSLHTARVVLVDKRGRQVGSYPGGLPIKPDDLAADIVALEG
ncbi:MAG: SCO family protein [Thermoleophilia bacterium]|nr:SCO family protein [Thermoleophilia bacterium]